MRLQNSEILALCKILLDSRAFTKDEMVGLLEKLVTCCVPKVNQKLVKELILNEEFHYVEPRHKTRFIEMMWEIGTAIHESKYIEIDYYRTKDKTVVHRKLRPAAIMFSEYYFYLTAFIDDEDVRKDFNVLNDAFPTIYRIDRIRSMRITDEKFHVPYRNRFEEGEFRKRIQFMYGGKQFSIYDCFGITANGSHLDRRSQRLLRTLKIKRDSMSDEDAAALTYLAMNTKRMSGGQKKLTNIFSNLIRYSFCDLLILDEPLNNLDYSNVRAFSNVLTRIYHTKPELAIILVTHCRSIPIVNRIIEIDPDKKAFSESESYTCSSCFGSVDSDGFYR